MTEERKIMRKVRYIELPRDKKREIGQKFGCAETTIYRALNCEMDSRLGADIRRMALDLGGVWATKVRYTKF